jgi:hypothetical protein
MRADGFLGFGFRSMAELVQLQRAELQAKTRWRLDTSPRCCLPDCISRKWARGLCRKHYLAALKRFGRVSGSGGRRHKRLLAPSVSVASGHGAEADP